MRFFICFFSCFGYNYIRKKVRDGMKKTGIKKSHYTLVELLVVVALAAILFGIGLPAFNVLTKGNAMTSSINDIAGKIKATRAYAVANNCYTAIIFPDANDSGWNTSLAPWQQKLSNQSCRSCIVYPRDNEGRWIFDSWIDGENWLQFGKGIILSRTTGSAVSGSHGFAYWSRIPLLDLSVSPVVNELATPPGGVTVTAADNNNVQRIQVPHSFLDQSASGSSAVTFHRVMIFRPNGQLLENIVFTLQEGVVTPGSGSTPEVTATQEVPVYYALGVNKYNGKITYYEPVSP